MEDPVKPEEAVKPGGVKYPKEVPKPEGPLKATRPDGTPIPGDDNPPPEIHRGPPKGWKCAKNGHIADADFPTGGPVVKTTQGTFYAFPTGRCIACECVFTLKQEVAEPTKLVKPDGSPQPDGGLIKP